MVLLVENCRIPFDDPNTHLELTMIHEVMVLDHSGPALGMIMYAAALKLFVFASLIINLVLPFGTGSSLIDWVIFLTGTLAVAVLVGTIESVMARLKMAEDSEAVDRCRRGVVVRRHLTAELLMSDFLLDPGLVLAILINFYVLTVTNLKEVIYAVAPARRVIGPALSRGGFRTRSRRRHANHGHRHRHSTGGADGHHCDRQRMDHSAVPTSRRSRCRRSIAGDVHGGRCVAVTRGRIRTALAIVFARTLPLAPQHVSHLPIPAALATVFCGFLMLSTRREALGQVLGYIVLENGVFIFGLLLIEAVPIMVELGIVLDLFCRCLCDGHHFQSRQSSVSGSERRAFVESERMSKPSTSYSIAGNLPA